MVDASDLGVKVLITVVVGWLLWKLVYIMRPPEAKKENPFNQVRSTKPKRVGKPSPLPKFLYRLARKSEATREGRMGEAKEEGKIEDTVGFEAKRQAETPLIGRSLAGGYFGVPGLDDKFLHLSLAHQVKGTAQLYFKGVEDLILIKYSSEAIERDESVELHFEEPRPPPGTTHRDGAFPHIYSSFHGEKPRLSWWNMHACIELKLGKGGDHVFPPGTLSDDEEDSVSTKVLTSTGADAVHAQMSALLK